MTDDDVKIRRMAQWQEALWRETLSPKAAAELASLRKLVLRELYGRLWHTTLGFGADTREGFSLVSNRGSIPFLIQIL
jgi:hypothetical protein